MNPPTLAPPSVATLTEELLKPPVNVTLAAVALGPPSEALRHLLGSSLVNGDEGGAGTRLPDGMQQLSHVVVAPAVPAVPALRSFCNVSELV